jgi:hypothetical protein
MVIPIALLCGLTWRRGGRHVALATAIWAAAICLAATLFAEPGSFGHWLHAIFTYGNTFDHWQPDLSSLAGLYIPYVPRMAGQLLSILAVGAGVLCAGAIIARDRHDQPGSERWWQWLMLGCSVWLTVLPYEHPYDAVLLVPAILVLLAAERGRALQGAVVAAVVAMICLPELDLMGFRPNLTFSYTVLPAILTVCALALQLRQGRQPAATAATVPPALPALQSAGGTAGPDRA